MRSHRQELRIARPRPYEVDAAAIDGRDATSDLAVLHAVVFFGDEGHRLRSSKHEFTILNNRDSTRAPLSFYLGDVTARTGSRCDSAPRTTQGSRTHVAGPPERTRCRPPRARGPRHRRAGGGLPKGR